jgi:hypothetical protein
MQLTRMMEQMLNKLTKARLSMQYRNAGAARAGQIANPALRLQR